MSTARDHAAVLLASWDKDGGFVGEGLAARREQLADPRDRALLTELTQGTLRRLGTVDAVLSRFSRRGLGDLHRAVRTALRIGAYQLIHLDRIPDHAIVGHAVDWTRARAGDARAGYVNAVLRSLARDNPHVVTQREDPRRDVPLADGRRVRFRRSVFPVHESDASINLAPRYAMPVWLVRRWARQYGLEITLAMLQAGIQRPELILRARPPHDARAVLAALTARGLEGREGSVPGAVVVRGSTHEALELVASGHAWVQDATSQRVAPLLAPKSGQRILDLCAAPGGKSVHIADLMRTGTLVACDVDAAKVEAMGALGEVMGDVVFEPRLVEDEGPLPFEAQSFDAVLIDAPCSNTGVLRRRVEARSRLRPDDIQTLAQKQRALLERAVPLVKPGGRLVFSTCSVEHEEGTTLAAAFEEAYPAFTRVDGFEVVPTPDHDGGFAAAWTRSP